MSRPSSAPPAPLSLADWRRRVAELYARARRLAQGDPVRAWQTFRAERDRLFQAHPQSPLDAEQRARFRGLSYFDYDLAWRLRGRVLPQVARVGRTVELPEGPLRFTRVARVAFGSPAGPTQLNLYWIEGYGGGLFLPFKDATNGRTTYGGGRYLYDTIKGADLGATADGLVLDFNFAYLPSCAYNSAWACPLAPAENTLSCSIEAGERGFEL